MKSYLLFIIGLLLLVSCSKNNVNNNLSVQETTETIENNFEEEIVDLYITNKTISSKPSFIFQEIGYKDENDNNFIEKLIILNSETGETINNIYLPDYTLFGDPIKGDALIIEYIDVNFDGYNDIQIFDVYNGNWNKFYIYFLWDKDTNKFIPDIFGLNKLGLPIFDKKNRVISSMERGSAADHWKYTHKYINGVLTVIEEISDVYVRLDINDKQQLSSNNPFLLDYHLWHFQHYIVKKINYDTLKLETVEEKYNLYIQNEREIEWEKIEEFDANSNIGRQLNNYISK